MERWPWWGIEAAGCTACPDASRIGIAHDHGHCEPTVVDNNAEIHVPRLAVRLPASTRKRLTLALRARTPSYAMPFNPDDEGRR